MHVTAYKFPLCSFQITLGFAIFTYALPAYGDYEYPTWAIVIGWLISTSSLVPIPIYLVYRIYKTPGTIVEVIYA